MLSWFINCVFILIFLPITLDFNFETQIKSISILFLVFRDLLVQKFLSDSLVNYSANLDPNSVIFYSVDLPSSSLSYYIKTHNFSPHFIVRFHQILKNTSKNTFILHGFDPYSPLCYLICD